MPGNRMLQIVVIKLIAPNIDDAPDKCKEKIICIGNIGPTYCFISCGINPATDLYKHLSTHTALSKRNSLLYQQANSQ